MKIYSVRVDSVHAEAYKVINGLNRVGQEHEQGDDAWNFIYLFIFFLYY